MASSQFSTAMCKTAKYSGNGDIGGTLIFQNDAFFRSCKTQSISLSYLWSNLGAWSNLKFILFKFVLCILPLGNE